MHTVVSGDFKVEEDVKSERPRTFSEFVDYESTASEKGLKVDAKEERKIKIGKFIF